MLGSTFNGSPLDNALLRAYYVTHVPDVPHEQTEETCLRECKLFMKRPQVKTLMNGTLLFNGANMFMKMAAVNTGTVLFGADRMAACSPLGDKRACRP